MRWWLVCESSVDTSKPEEVAREVLMMAKEIEGEREKR